MAKASKLYSDSPSLKRDDESGEVGVSRPSDSAAVDMGLEGNPLPGSEGKMPIHVHEKMQEMVERHQAELRDMQKRHQKEHEKISGVKDGEKLEDTPAPKKKEKE